MTTTLVLVRHGESERNVKRELAKGKPDIHLYHEGLRDIDVKLTKRGLEQAHTTGEYLAANSEFNVVFVSPYKRTLQTAEAILSHFDPKPEMVRDERIREIEFGILDGVTNALTSQALAYMPCAVAVNPSNNIVYVSHCSDSRISILYQ